MTSFERVTKLMQHQVDAVNKLLPTRVGGLLMDMGTGKSLTAIELVRLRQDKINRVVWFCPVSLKETVKGEILKHTNVSEDDICVFDDVINEKNIPKASWYIIGIESLSSSARVIFTTHKLITQRTYVILDESSYCKNHRANRTMRITSFSKDARYRLIMTGTVITQGVVDLYAQMYFLSPKILGYSSFYSFAANHLEYSDKYPGMIVRGHNLEYLAAKINPYTYQVTKDECLDLPNKRHATSYLWLTDEQREIYEDAKDYYLSKLEDNNSIDRYFIFQLFNALQQITSGFWNRNGIFHEFKHDRIETLLATIRDFDTEKVIIWAKYRYDIDSISDALKESYGDGSVALYYGDIPEKRRRLEEQKFRNEAQFFVATQGTGGHGLTLNESSHVIFYNNGFKYAEREQAEDRCHRIGQDREVLYTDIHCCNTIDDRIFKALTHKGNVVDDFRSEVDKVKKEGLKELIKSL